MGGNSCDPIKCVEQGKECALKFQEIYNRLNDVEEDQVDTKTLIGIVRELAVSFKGLRQDVDKHILKRAGARRFKDALVIACVTAILTYTLSHPDVVLKITTNLLEGIQ